MHPWHTGAVLPDLDGRGHSGMLPAVIQTSASAHRESQDAICVESRGGAPIASVVVALVRTSC